MPADPVQVSRHHQALQRHRECANASFKSLLGVFMWIARLPVPGSSGGQPTTYPNAAEILDEACRRVVESRQQTLADGVSKPLVVEAEAEAWSSMPISESITALESQRERDRLQTDFGPRLVRECDSALGLIRLMPDRIDFANPEPLSECIRMHSEMPPDGSLDS